LLGDSLHLPHSKIANKRLLPLLIASSFLCPSFTFEDFNIISEAPHEACAPSVFTSHSAVDCRGCAAYCARGVCPRMKIPTIFTNNRANSSGVFWLSGFGNPAAVGRFVITVNIYALNS
jgi:hypothetical protein